MALVSPCEKSITPSRRVTFIKYATAFSLARVQLSETVSIAAAFDKNQANVAVVDESLLELSCMMIQPQLPFSR